MKYKVEYLVDRLVSNTIKQKSLIMQLHRIRSRESLTDDEFEEMSCLHEAIERYRYHLKTTV